MIWITSEDVGARDDGFHLVLGNQPRRERMSRTVDEWIHSMRFHLNVNRHDCEADVQADTPLLTVLRDDLGLTGTRFGCGQGVCGAYYVLADGFARADLSGRACAPMNSRLALPRRADTRGRGNKAALDIAQFYQFSNDTSGCIFRHISVPV